MAEDVCGKSSGRRSEAGEKERQKRGVRATKEVVVDLRQFERWLEGVREKESMCVCCV